MNISTFAAITVTLLVFFVGIRYCVKLVRKEISPRVATWLIFEIGVVMSLASYLAGKDHSFIKAALNVADSVQVTVILVALLIRQRGQRFEFTRNELFSIPAGNSWSLMLNLFSLNCCFTSSTVPSRIF